VSLHLCPHCHEPHPPQASFCPSTGRPLASAASAPPPALVAPQVQAPMAAMPPPPPAWVPPVMPAPLPPPAPVPDGALARGSLPGGPATAGVRHSYPLAIEQAGLGTALGLLMRTLPYAGVRFGVLVLASILTIVFWVIALAGGAFLAGKVAPFLGWIFVIGCLVGFGFFWRLFLRYFLHLLKCGHIAVLTELVTKGRIANGSEGMFSYGKRVVTERFGEVNVLFGVDLLVDGVVRAFNRTLDFIGGLLPVPALQQLLVIVKAIVRAASTYIDETIFSYGLAREERNPWASARDGLVYYGQNSKEILKTSVWIVVLDYAFTFLVWLVMLAPAFALSHALPQSMFLASLAAWLIAILFAGSFRSAFIKPLFLIMVMTRFHVSIRNQPINLEWEARLERVSSKFRELKDKVAGTSMPAPLPPGPSA
jgi:hypothetical protein